MQLKEVKEKCPAFSNGCPYATITTTQELKSVTKKCPEFSSGCPFSSVKQIELFSELLTKVPESHVKSPEIHATLERIHKISTELKEEVGNCPIFSNECIFKVKCTNLQPLIKELDLRTWGLIIKVLDKEKTPQTVGLAKSLKVGTGEAHRAAESVQFVRQFLRGRISKDIYAKFVACLYFIYKAIEEEARNNRDHVIFKHVHFPSELEREKALEGDLKYYYGVHWKEEIKPFLEFPPVKEYVERVHMIGISKPALLVAHTYTRYLGDLSGGQVLKRVAVKTYSLPSTGEGTYFYDFDKLPTKVEHKKFKEMYRQTLDSLDVDQELATSIVEEANVGFNLNTNLFRFLDDLAGVSVPTVTPSPNNVQVHGTGMVGGDQKATCPFATMSSVLQTKEKHGNSDGIGQKIHVLLKPYYSTITRVFVAFLVVLVGLILW
eukprot:TRINITY_DN9474_c0_g3_i4.p1 TRINITY_DN9474_c0_g3~~TRINITY_DN9474_c0_g3_i4.p1  ORF type:complete len:435 (-),score=87.66 TRINITY_DN9474_c0_g3_i4:39-1343(-)